MANNDIQCNVLETKTNRLFDCADCKCTQGLEIVKSKKGNRHIAVGYVLVDETKHYSCPY